MWVCMWEGHHTLSYRLVIVGLLSVTLGTGTFYIIQTTTKPVLDGYFNIISFYSITWFIWEGACFLDVSHQTRSHKIWETNPLQQADLLFHCKHDYSFLFLQRNLHILTAFYRIFVELYHLFQWDLESEFSQRVC